MKHLLPLLALLCASCAGSIYGYYPHTPQGNADRCAMAEDLGDLAQAEQSCAQALQDPDWEAAGPQIKSQRLYNYGRIERMRGKFPQAEGLLRRSLDLESKISGPASVPTGRRLVELSVTLAAQDKWDEGAQFLQQAIPISPQFMDRDRDYAHLVFGKFAEHLNGTQADLAAKFKAAAEALGGSQGVY